MKPLILIDVDGVLNPWHRQGPHWISCQAVSGTGTFPVVLNPDHGPALLRLAAETGAELVWATMWERHANGEIGARIGLPELPVIDIDGHPGVPGVHPKVAPVAEYVGGRPFVWFDDELGADDYVFLRAHRGVGEFLLVHVGPGKGLADRHLEMAAAWLSTRTDAGGGHA